MFTFQNRLDSVFGLAVLTAKIETFLLNQLFFVILNFNCIGMYEAYIYTILELKKVVYKYIPCMVELKHFLRMFGASGITGCN